MVRQEAEGGYSRSSSPPLPRQALVEVGGEGFSGFQTTYARPPAMAAYSKTPKVVSVLG
jgi:hypothetical protein